MALLLLWCIALLVYWIYLESDSLAVGMLWNLFLAVIPLAWGAAFKSASAQKRPYLAGVFFFLWLLFLPNAPYILTDLLHLKPHPQIPLWYLLAALLSCAGTGTMLGYLSLLDVHAAVEEKWGAIAGWSTVAGSILLCGFGIYLGRFLRWNSWDALAHPIHLLRTAIGQFIDSGAHPHPFAVSSIFGIGLFIGYLALRVFATSMRDN